MFFSPVFTLSFLFSIGLALFFFLTCYNLFSISDNDYYYYYCCRPSFSLSSSLFPFSSISCWQGVKKSPFCMFLIWRDKWRWKMLIPSVSVVMTCRETHQTDISSWNIGFLIHSLPNLPLGLPFSYFSISSLHAMPKDLVSMILC